MLFWLQQNIGTIAVSGLLLAAAGLTVRKLLREKRSASCGCGCAGCGMREQCHKQAKQSDP